MRIAVSTDSQRLKAPVVPHMARVGAAHTMSAGGLGPKCGPYSGTAGLHC